MASNNGNGKVAWIVGGTTGLGRAISVMLADAGYDVVNTAPTVDPFCEPCDDIRWAGGQSVCIAADVTDRAAVDRARDEIVKRFGRIDVLVNKANFNVRHRSWGELVPEEFDAVIATNLTGSFNAIQAVLPVMRKQGSGVIVNMSSVAGRLFDQEGGVAYSVARAGLQVMTRLLNQSEKRHGIRACTIAPACEDIPESAKGQSRFEPEDVARAVRLAVEQGEGAAISEIEVSCTPRR